MDKFRCPYCKSTNVNKPKYSRKTFAISMLLLGFPLFFKNKTRYCFDCSRELKV